jgi:hypothetical protein
VARNRQRPFGLAHNAALASGPGYAIDSYFTRVIRDVGQRFERRLFVSATPHNGHSNSFAALLEILDPRRFCRGVPVKGPKLLEQVMVRRLKEYLRQIEGGFIGPACSQAYISGCLLTIGSSMIERRTGFLTRLIVDDMIDVMSAGIRLKSDEELVFFISSQITMLGAGLPHPEFLNLARRIARSSITALLKPVF